MFTPTDPTSAGHRGCRFRRLSVALAGGALVLAACGGGDADSTSAGVASLGDAPAAETTDTTVEPGSAEAADEAAEPADDAAGAAGGDGADLEAPADQERAFELYDECLQDAGIDVGVADIGDGAVVEGDGQTDAQVLDTGELDDDAFEALDRCEGHLANVDVGFDLSPEQQAELQDAELAFARCMREQGIDMPDPSGDQGGVIEITGDFDEEAFQAAADECNTVFDEIFDEFGDA